MAIEKFRLYAANQTGAWPVSVLTANHIEAAFGLYLVREGERTHCCSMQADAWAEHLSNEFIAETPEDRDDIYDDGSLCYEGLEDCYFGYGDVWDCDARFRSERVITVKVDARSLGGLRSQAYHRAIWEAAREIASENSGYYEPPILNEFVYQEYQAEQRDKRRAMNIPPLVTSFNYMDQLPLFVAAARRIPEAAIVAAGWVSEWTRQWYRQHPEDLIEADRAKGLLA